MGYPSNLEISLLRLTGLSEQILQMGRIWRNNWKNKEKRKRNKNRI